MSRCSKEILNAYGNITKCQQILNISMKLSFYFNPFNENPSKMLKKLFFVWYCIYFSASCRYSHVYLMYLCCSWRQESSVRKEKTVKYEKQLTFLWQTTRLAVHMGKIMNLKMNSVQKNINMFLFLPIMSWSGRLCVWL